MIETCPYCRETIDTEDVIRCPSCRTPHHNACFAENGGCTIFGCESAPADAPKISVGSFDIATSPPPSPFPSELQSNRTLYFVNRSGEELGPYSLTELQQCVAGGHLSGTDLAWSEGMPQWMFVGDILGNLRSPNSNLAVRANASAAGGLLEGRLHFGRGLFFLGIVGLSLIKAAFSGSTEIQALGTLLFISGWIVIALLRVRDIGMSEWTVLLAVVPIANLFLYYRLFCAPRGYEITKRADTAMEVIGWSFGGLIVLGILIAILSSATR